MKHSLSHGGGFLEVDHRNSPGVAPGELPGMPGSVLVVPGGTLFEADAFTCCHCSAIVVKNPARVRPRGYCAKCDHVVCDNPICNTECNPVAKLLDQAREHVEKFIGREDNPEASPLVLLTDRE